MRKNEINTLFFDVDGIFTDGSLYYGPNGEAMKVFHVHDGYAIKRFLERNFQIYVITGRSSEMVKTRFNELGVDRIYMGVDQKATLVRTIQEENSIDRQNCLFMGDDRPDVECIDDVQIFVSVPNARREVKALAHWITNVPGGQGAVRELFDWLIDD